MLCRMPLRIRPTVRLGRTRVTFGKTGPSVSTRLAPGVSYQWRPGDARGQAPVLQRPERLAVVLAPTTGFWLTLLGGWFGLHRFARHQPGLGLLYLLTAGLFTVGWIVDSIAAGVRLARS